MTGYRHPNARACRGSNRFAVSPETKYGCQQCLIDAGTNCCGLRQITGNQRRYVTCTMIQGGLYSGIRVVVIAEGIYTHSRALLRRKRDAVFSSCVSDCLAAAGTSIASGSSSRSETGSYCPASALHPPFPGVLLGILRNYTSGSSFTTKYLVVLCRRSRA